MLTWDEEVKPSSQMTSNGGATQHRALDVSSASFQVPATLSLAASATPLLRFANAATQHTFSGRTFVSHRTQWMQQNHRATCIRHTHQESNTTHDLASNGRVTRCADAVFLHAPMNAMMNRKGPYRFLATHVVGSLLSSAFLRLTAC